MCRLESLLSESLINSLYSIIPNILNGRLQSYFTFFAIKPQIIINLFRVDSKYSRLSLIGTRIRGISS